MFDAASAPGSDEVDPDTLDEVNEDDSVQTNFLRILRKLLTAGLL